MSTHDRPDTSIADERIGTVSALLWLTLVISLMGNSLASFAGVGVLTQLVIGAVTAASVAGLIAHRLRSR